jgi:hypothetical protein
MRSQKVDIYYVLTFIFLLLTANANILSTSAPCWFAFTAIMLMIVVYKKLVTLADVKNLLVFSGVFLLFVAIRDLAVNQLDSDFLVSDVSFLFKSLYLVYFYCLILKDKIAYYLVKVITHLTIISFFFFAIQLINSGDLIYKFSTSLNLLSDNQLPGYTNFLLFTFVKDFHDYSNCGFVWEPAAFGSFLVIALLLNFFLNNFTFDRKAKILIAGIITTFGTTDYLALLIVLFLVYRYKVPKLNGWAVVIILLFIGAIITVPILGSKISDTYYEDMDDLGRLKFLAVYYKKNNMQIPLNRFSSMVYIYDNFGANLILGVSNKYDAIINKQYSINISNGISDILARYGLVGLIFLLYKYTRFCVYHLIKAEYVIYCILALLVIGFGEPILTLPFVMVFLFVPLKQTSNEDKDSRRPKRRHIEEFKARQFSTN